MKHYRLGTVIRIFMVASFVSMLCFGCQSGFRSSTYCTQKSGRKPKKPCCGCSKKKVATAVTVMLFAGIGATNYLSQQQQGLHLIQNNPTDLYPNNLQENFNFEELLEQNDLRINERENVFRKRNLQPIMSTTKDPKKKKNLAWYEKPFHWTDNYKSLPKWFRTKLNFAPFVACFCCSSCCSYKFLYPRCKKKCCDKESEAIELGEYIND